MSAGNSSSDINAALALLPEARYLRIKGVLSDAANLYSSILPTVESGMKNNAEDYYIVCMEYAKCLIAMHRKEVIEAAHKNEEEEEVDEDNEGEEEKKEAEDDDDDDEGDKTLNPENGDDTEEEKNDIDLAWEVLEVALKSLQDNPLPDKKRHDLFLSEILILEGQVLAEQMLYSVASSQCNWASTVLIEYPDRKMRAIESLYMSILYAIKYKNFNIAKKRLAILAEFAKNEKNKLLMDTVVKIKDVINEASKPSNASKQDNMLIKLSKKLLKSLNLPEEMALYTFGAPDDEVVETVGDAVPVPVVTADQPSTSSATVVAGPSTSPIKKSPIKIPTEPTTVSSIQHLVRRKPEKCEGSAFKVPESKSVEKKGAENGESEKKLNGNTEVEEEEDVALYMLTDEPDYYEKDDEDMELIYEHAEGADEEMLIEDDFVSPKSLKDQMNEKKALETPAVLAHKVSPPAKRVKTVE